MARRIGVIGGGPAWRRGVAGILGDAGFETVEVLDLAAWRPGRSGQAIALRCPDPDALLSLTEFTGEHPHIPVVAVMPILGVAEYAAAIRAGAAGAVADDDDAAAFGAAFEAAFIDRMLVPSTVLRAFIARLPDSLDDQWLDHESVELLRGLAAGSTVAALADQAGYSEREMFRMLKELYAALGVENRTQAIIWATRQGILDERDASS